MPLSTPSFPTVVPSVSSTEPLSAAADANPGAETRLEHPEVEVSLIFGDISVEKAFRQQLGGARQTGDILYWIIGTLMFWKFYSQAIYVTIVGNMVWVLSTLAFVFLVGYTSALVSCHPLVIRVKPVLMPVASSVGAVVLKLLVHLSPHAHRSSRSPGLVGVLRTSAFLQSFFNLGLWNSGGTMLSTVAITSCVQFLHIFWNKPECQMIWKFQPKVMETIQVYNYNMWSLVWKEPLVTEPLNACILVRGILQVVMGGVSIAVAYWREMRERKAFLVSCNIPYSRRTPAGYLSDALHICGVLITSMGFVTALIAAFPELEDFPISCLGDWDPKE
eukprot:jgi/Botrbrau1/13311/Bobra.0315s0009.1